MCADSTLFGLRVIYHKHVFQTPDVKFPGFCLGQNSPLNQHACNAEAEDPLFLTGVPGAHGGSQVLHSGSLPWNMLDLKQLNILEASEKHQKRSFKPV